MSDIRCEKIGQANVAGVLNRLRAFSMRARNKHTARLFNYGKVRLFVGAGARPLDYRDSPVGLDCKARVIEKFLVLLLLIFKDIVNTLSFLNKIVFYVVLQVGIYYNTKNMQDFLLLI